VGSYSLEVSNNNQDYTALTREFTYYGACDRLPCLGWD
jgi:hypothetical protein